MTEETAKTPEWMLLLENKKKKPHRLAHDIGAGAPCLSCGDNCPGLDLHFWRKLCRNCKCKKEEHDVKDDEGYEQFEILFANTGVGKKKRPGALLNIKVPEVTPSASSSASNKKGVAFDWVPPDVPEEVAAEYMQQLPPSKLPISGSDGALYRRQQLETQIPLHDLDATRCHGLSAEEIKGLQQYLENLQNNVVGQGRVTKLPVLYSEQRMKYSGPMRHQSVTVAQASVTGESRPMRISTSQSAQCLKSLPSYPLPRPYTAQHYDKDDPNSFPPPPPDMLPPLASNLGLKTPSAFLPSAQHTGPTGEMMKDEVNPGKFYSGDGVSDQSSEMKPLTYANDGTFVSEQQAHDVAFSSQIPVGMSQLSKVLNPSNDSSQEGQFSNVAEDSDKFQQSAVKDGKFYTDDIPKDTLYSTSIPGGVPQISNAHVVGTNLPQDGKILSTQIPSNVAFSSMTSGGMPQFSSQQGTGIVPQDGAVSLSQHPGNVPGQSVPSYGSLNTGVPSQDAKYVPYSTNIPGHIVHSAAVASDSMPKSAHLLHQSHLVQQEGWEPETMENELSGKLKQLAGLGDGSLMQEENYINCHKCREPLLPGQVAVVAERASKQAAWHPQCFVCCTCEELLVDLIYFYHKDDVYCGRHYAELLSIPRCFACDELIFVKEYTCAEGKAFHVKHFCCYECDIPLGGKQYVPKDNQPVCLQCFESKYGKSCHTCKQKIAPQDQRVGWKELSWHVSPSCFCCSQCVKSLLGGKFLVKHEELFCSKECYQTAISILDK